jgi:hypothetical protein
MLISILRDPPGGGSSASYENAESTVVINTGSYEVFDGVAEEGMLGIGAEFEGDACVGFIGQICFDVAKFEALFGSTGSRSIERSLPQGFSGDRQLARTYTWSMSTSEGGTPGG